MDKKKKILSVLKIIKRGSTTQISFVAFGSTNPWMARKYLEQLEKDGLVVSEQETNALYWKLNKKEDLK